MQLQHYINAIHQLQTQAQLDLQQKSPSQLQTAYFGKKGLFTLLAKSLKDVDTMEKKAAGQALNQLKLDLQELFAQTQSQASQRQWEDLTIPGLTSPTGHRHPVSQAIEEITRIFTKIGFTRVRYPEVDYDWYAFEALNMPANHPARDEWETFFVDVPASETKGKVVLTPHTSNGQVREMERLQSKPPCE